MSSFQQTPERVSTITSCLYECFCERLFTTYPGIYLHLKSKHGNVFLKYKKLKITKLFHKAKTSNGKEIYRLQKLNERQSSTQNFNQKKIKQCKKRTKSVLSSARQMAEEQSSSFTDRRKEKNIPVLRSHQQTHPQQRIKNNAAQSPPKERQILNQPNQHFPYQGVHQKCLENQCLLDSYNYGRFNPPTIKKLLQAFLVQSESSDKKGLKNALYNMMVFLDKNYEHLKDPRCRQKAFLSYCDLFDHHFIGSMLQQYIHHFGIHILETEGEQARENKKELEHLLLFAKWLKYCRIMDLHIEQLPPIATQGRKKNFLFKTQNIVEQDCIEHGQSSKGDQPKKDLLNVIQQEV